MLPYLEVKEGMLSSSANRFECLPEPIMEGHRNVVDQLFTAYHLHQLNRAYFRRLFSSTISPVLSQNTTRSTPRRQLSNNTSSIINLSTPRILRSVTYI